MHWAVCTNDVPDVQLLITADHGMSDKRRMLHLPAILARRNIRAQAVPVIKDLYVVHHSNLGGCIYVHLDDPAATQDAIGVLRETDGVEEVLTREDAAQRFSLMPERLGGLVRYRRAGRGVRRPRRGFAAARVAFAWVRPRNQRSDNRVRRRFRRVRIS